MRGKVRQGVLRASNGALGADVLGSLGIDGPAAGGAAAAVRAPRRAWGGGVAGCLGMAGPAPGVATLAVAPAPTGPYEAAPRLLSLPRPGPLDSSSAVGTRGPVSYLTP